MKKYAQKNRNNEVINVEESQRSANSGVWGMTGRQFACIDGGAAKNESYSCRKY